MSGRDEAERARLAIQRVRQNTASEDWTVWRAMVLKLPVMIHNEGLSEALHFVAARGKPAQKHVLRDLAEDLDFAGASELLAMARTADHLALNSLTRRAARQVAWYKRAAQAVGPDGVDPHLEAVDA